MWQVSILSFEIDLSFLGGGMLGFGLPAPLGVYLVSPTDILCLFPLTR